jgi:hypothetical protein
MAVLCIFYVTELELRPHCFPDKHQNWIIINYPLEKHCKITGWTEKNCRVEVLQISVTIQFKPTEQYNLAAEVASWEACIWMVFQTESF